MLGLTVKHNIPFRLFLDFPPINSYNQHLICFHYLYKFQYAFFIPLQKQAIYFQIAHHLFEFEDIHLNMDSTLYSSFDTSS